VGNIICHAFCKSIAPNPCIEVSVCNFVFAPVLYKFNTDLFDNFSFNWINASLFFTSKIYLVFAFNKSLNGRAIVEYCSMNFRKYPLSPKKLCNCFTLEDSGNFYTASILRLDGYRPSTSIFNNMTEKLNLSFQKFTFSPFYY